MESKKSLSKGKLALLLGILAGFGVLGVLFVMLDNHAIDSEIMFWVAIMGSMISIFLASVDPPKSKSCTTSESKKANVSD